MKNVKNLIKTSKKENIRLKYFLINLIIIILCLIIAESCLYNSARVTEVFCENFDKFAAASCLIDAKSKTIFYGENIHKRLPMASTTKIMTAILAIEKLNLNKMIKINKNAIGVEGSSIYLSLDKEYKIKDLIYGLMLRSGNDAAEALAYEISGSIENFAQLMNEKAKELGLEDTHFVNPHGLHHDDHYTSAYDLAIISAYALDNPIFLDVVSSKMHIIESEEGVYYNKNKLLSSYEGANGVKTGYTTVAGKCLVSSANRYGRQVVCVVLDCNNTWDCSKKLLDFAFSNYDIYKLIDKNKIFAQKDNIKLAFREDLCVALDKNESSKITLKLRFNSNLSKIIPANTFIGYVDVYINNCLLFSKKIYNIERIENNKDINKLFSLQKEFNNGEN